MFCCAIQFRFASDSPTSDIDGRTPKGRGKRGRTCVNVARSDMNSSDRKLRSNRCVAGKSTTAQSSGGSGSPVRSESGGALPPKRPRGADAAAGSSSNSDGSRANSKSSRSDSRTSNAECDGSNADAPLMECPAPNCSKKYRHVNGLRYHQSRAHPDMVFDDDDNNEDVDGSTKSTDSEQQRPTGKMSRLKMTADDVESVSDGDVWQASSNDMAVSLDGSGQPMASDLTKLEKKSKSKSKTTMSAAAGCELLDAPASPSSHKLVPSSKSVTDDTPTREKSKHRKKERDRGRETSVVVVEHLPESDTKTLTVAESGEPFDSTIDAPQLDCVSHAHSLPASDGLVSTGSAFVSTAQPRNEVLDSSLSTDPLMSAKKMKTIPVKQPQASDQDNPNSPAYSDISDANDAAPMLEKEAAPSVPLDDEEILPSGSVLGEQRPLSRHVPGGFSGNFSGSSSTLYGQPPCLTPAVASSLGEADTVKPQSNMRTDPPNAGASLADDRSSSRTNLPSRSQPGTESGRRSMTSDAPVESAADRTSQQSTARFSSSSDPCSSPLPSVFPTQMLMAYQYVNPNLDAAMLMQHPEYRAHYERLIQQEVTRRHDSPSHHASSPDIKGSPASRPLDADRRGLPPPGKGDASMAIPSLPTPPSLIPDRFDDHESRRKMKSAERRDEAMKLYQGGPAASERMRRQDDTSAVAVAAVSKEVSGGGGAKPSAVVAPQARDRAALPNKMRPDDHRARQSVPPPPRAPSPHDHSRNKPSVSTKTIAASHTDMPRMQKDVTSERSSREEKAGPAAGRSSQPFKTKEELAGTASSVPNVPPSLAMSYAPYYPYLPSTPQYAHAAAGLPYDPSTIYPGINPSIIGYAGTSGAPPAAFLHPAQMGYIAGASSAGPGDVPKMISPAGAPMVSPPDAKSREAPPRNFFAGDSAPSAPAVHKIHELKEVAKGSGAAGPLEVLAAPSAAAVASGAPVAGAREVARPESRGSVGLSGAAKEHERGSPPMQRHLHTHHHMHMLGPSLFGSVFPGDRTYCVD